MFENVNFANIGSDIFGQFYVNKRNSTGARR
jgi:hypothetical protein